MRGNQLTGPILCAVLGVCGGLVGGVIANRVKLPIWPAASAASPTMHLVSAGEFDLVGADGRIGAKLFMDRGTTPTISLYDGKGKEEITLFAEEKWAAITIQASDRRLVLENDPNNTEIIAFDLKNMYQRFALTTDDRSTSLHLLSPDNYTAVETVIDADGSEMSFTDNRARDLLALGIKNNDSPLVDIYDTKGQIRSELSHNLSLFDDVGKLRSVLGSTVLKNVKTGSTTNLSPSSLVLFGENGRVLWQAP